MRAAAAPRRSAEPLALPQDLRPRTSRLATRLALVPPGRGRQVGGGK